MQQTRHTKKALLSSLLAASVALAPLLALADGSVIQLRPLQDNTHYTNTYTNNAYSNPNNTTGTDYGFSNANTANTGYGNNYYSPDDSNTLRGRLISIPKGTLLSVHVDQSMTASAVHIGDPVSATLENDVYINDAVAIPAGSQVLGQVANVNPPGHLGRHGEVDVRFDSVKLTDGRVVPIPAHIVTQDKTGVLKGDTYTKDVFKGVGIAAAGTGLGTLMGTAAGGLIGSVGGGALFGLGVGALGGMGYAVARKGKDVIVPAGSRMSLMIDTPVTFNN